MHNNPCLLTWSSRPHRCHRHHQPMEAVTTSLHRLMHNMAPVSFGAILGLLAQDGEHLIMLLPHGSVHIVGTVPLPLPRLPSNRVLLVPGLYVQPVWA